MTYQLLNKFLKENEGNAIVDTIKTTLPVLDDLAIIAYQKYKNEKKDKERAKKALLKKGNSNNGK